MKIKPVEIEKDDSDLYKNVPITTRIKSLVGACPFDLEKFYDENKGLVKKYLRKNTYSLEVEDWKDVPDDWYYKNNEGILRHNIADKKDRYNVIQMLEWIKCGVDIVYMTQKYVKIISIDDGVIPFKLYDYQEDLLNLYNDNRFVISMQARQSGKTQTTAAFMMHFAIFNGSKFCAILANKTDQAQEILARIQMSYENLPLYLQPGVRSYNKRSMEFGHRSRIASFASGSSSIRGKSISLLYIDEAAFIPGDMEFYESTYPVISSGAESRIIVTSTPNGTRGLFHKLWKESVDKSNGYKNMLVTWDMVPGRDEKWKQETIANTSPEQFAQEYECVSGETIITLSDDSETIFNLSVGDFYDCLESLNSEDNKYIQDHLNIRDITMGKSGVVYRLIREDGLSYIGTTVDIKKRLHEHKKSPKFSEYGLVDYEILFEGDYYDCLLNEENFIKEFNTFKNGLNMTETGRGKNETTKFNTLGRKHSDETRKKISIGNKNKKIRRGWKHSEETKKYYSETRKGVLRDGKISIDERTKLLKEYDEFTFSYKDVYQLLKTALKDDIDNNGYTGQELIAKNGHKFDKFKVFSIVKSNEYGVTQNCIKNLIKKYHKND